MLFKLGIMYALILVGIVIRRRVKGIDGFTKVISKLLINVLVPVVIFSSTMQFSITLIDVRIILFSCSIFFFSSVLAYVFLRILRLKGDAVGPFVLNSVNANQLYLPLPIIFALYGSVGLAYSTLFLFIFNVATTFYFIPLYSYYSSERRKKGTFLLRFLLFPPFIASVLGLISLSLSYTFPQQVVQPASYIGQLTTYLALLFVGLNIKLERGNWLSRPVLGVSAIRLLILPLLIFGLLKSLGLIEIWGSILIIHAGMPPAVNNIIFTDYYGLDKKLTATIVAETTLFTLLTLPLLIFLGESIVQ